MLLFGPSILYSQSLKYQPSSYRTIIVLVAPLFLDLVEFSCIFLKYPSVSYISATILVKLLYFLDQKSMPGLYDIDTEAKPMPPKKYYFMFMKPRGKIGQSEQEKSCLIFCDSWSIKQTSLTKRPF